MYPEYKTPNLAGLARVHSRVCSVAAVRMAGVRGLGGANARGWRVQRGSSPGKHLSLDRVRRIRRVGA